MSINNWFDQFAQEIPVFIYYRQIRRLDQCLLWKFSHYYAQDY